MSVERRASGVEREAASGVPARCPCPVTRHPPLATRRAFTLIEMLVVLSIMAIIAALAVPALKNFGHADAMTGADQQLLNDVARARQLAISQRTTVYMIFVPSSFWNNYWNNMTPAQRALTATTNLCDKQLTGYTFAAYGTVGDQPGQHQWHYLAPWQSLPDGTFIALQKFNVSPNSPAVFYTITDPLGSGHSYRVYGFDLTNTIPFPSETNYFSLYVPYIAFNYLGQLTDDGQNLASQHEYIPLARGSVVPAVDPATKTFQLRPPQLYEVPPGNSTNAYNLIDIDPLTGRATLQEPKVQ
ncbi:MAG TPA: type II secretion system protein [Verrucomicrobiae bacterium]|nr:type II secretion system protein [Verrucomicrobiae bacterium]